MFPSFRLKLQAALTGTFCEFLDTAMVYVTAAVKYDSLDTLSQCTLSNQLADLACSFLVAAILAEVLLGGGCSCKRYALDIIDDLSKNVLRASEYVETRTLSSTGNCAAYSLMASETLLVRVFL